MTIPTIQCPKCGHEEENFDGFGFAGECPKCGYCPHLCRDKIDEIWTCSVCGAELGEQK